MPTNESDCPGAPPFVERLECIRPPASHRSKRSNGSVPPLPSDHELERSSNTQLLRMLLIGVHSVRTTAESTHDAVQTLCKSHVALESRVSALEGEKSALYLGAAALLVAIVAMISQVIQ